MLSVLCEKTESGGRNLRFLLLLAFLDVRLSFAGIMSWSGFPFQKANPKRSCFILTNIYTMIPTLENENLNVTLLQSIKLRYEHYS